MAALFGGRAIKPECVVNVFRYLRSSCVAVPIVNPIRWPLIENRAMLQLDVDLCKLIFGTMIDLLRSRATLEAEIVVLRQQINVLRRANPRRLRFASIDRLILGCVCRLFPKMNHILRGAGGFR